MSRFFFLILSLPLLFAFPALAQVRWDGQGNDGRWENALNWSADALPGPDDEVLLDHSFVPVRYDVELPAEVVAVRSITIDPAEGDTIELRLPAASRATPSLVIAGAAYGLTINRKAVFRNLSGATAGIALSISDSIRINNGGRFIHSSASGHASLVQVLSALPGTEKGIMEFDVPGASTTISLSGRVFGTLAFRSAARGTALNYTAAGTRPVQIRGNLELEEGVNFNLNFSDTIFIGGQLLQRGGTLDLGNTARSVVIAVNGDIMQGESGLLTETGTGTPVLLLNGNAETRIELLGRLTETITVEKNGPATAVLLAPLFISHCLRLQKGILVSSQEAPLVFLPGSRLEVDSLGAKGFVQGPVRREGLAQEAFLFPVGGNGVMRWLALDQATGSFTVEYHRGDPLLLSPVMGEGIHHVSRLEYWEIGVEDPLSGRALLKLSFYDPNSGGVTDMEQLRGGRLLQGVWRDAGTVAFAGTPGATGWVSVGPVISLSAEHNFFALASAAGTQNPLPLADIPLYGSRGSEGVELSWEQPAGLSVREFELQASADSRNFFTVCTVTAIPVRRRYHYTHTPGTGLWYYRVLGRSSGSSAPYFSRTIRVPDGSLPGSVLMAAGITGRIMRLKFFVEKNTPLDLVLYSSVGIPVKRIRVEVSAGTSVREIPLQHLPQGIYYLQERRAGRGVGVHRLINR